MEETKQPSLMELVETCQPNQSLLYADKANDAKDLAEDLRSVGFSMAAEKLATEVSIKEKLNRVTKGGYIVITEAQIAGYMSNKIAADFATGASDTVQNLTRFGYIPGELQDIASWHPEKGVTLVQGVELLGAQKFVKSSETYLVWVERTIETYPGIPPQHVIDRLKEERKRNVFDYYTIAEVRGFDIHDPLLLGRLKGCNDRFFIAQWGTDIHIEDLL